VYSMWTLAPFDVVNGARSRHRYAIGAQKDANGMIPSCRSLPPIHNSFPTEIE
jgi:hypothetical protein